MGSKEDIFLERWMPARQPQPVKIYQIDDDHVFIVLGSDDSCICNTTTGRTVSSKRVLPNSEKLVYENQHKCMLISGLSSASTLWVDFEPWQRVFIIGKIGVYKRKRDLKSIIRTIAKRANDLNVGDSFDFIRGHSAFGEDGIVIAVNKLIPALKNKDPEIRRTACWALYELACHIGPIRDLGELGGEDSLIALRRTIRPLQKMIQCEQDEKVLHRAQSALDEFRNYGMLNDGVNPP